MHYIKLSTYVNGPISENSGTGIIHFHGTGQFSDGREISSNITGFQIPEGWNLDLPVQFDTIFGHFSWCINGSHNLDHSALP